MLIDRWSPSAGVFLALIKLLQLLRRCGVRPQEDGFRRATRVLFRTQESHACMAAFGLNASRPLVTTDALGSSIDHARLLIQLRDFLATRPDMQKRLRWERWQARVVKRETMDIVKVGFTEDGRLDTCVPFLDPQAPHPGADCDSLLVVCRELVHAYNQTHHHPDRRRPRDLRRSLLRRLEATPGASPATRRERARSADRLLSAIWVAIETVPAHDHFQTRLKPPPLGERLGPGSGGFVITARLYPSLHMMDLWFDFHHALFDGAPFAELLADLERWWGIRAPLVLPSLQPFESTRPHVRCSAPGPKESWVVEDCVDFTPLLKERMSMQAGLDRRANRERVGVLSLLLWRFAHVVRHRDIKFTIAVEVPPAPGRERTLGIAAIRPAAFFDTHDPYQAFAAFNRELNRRISQTRERRSETYELVESISLLPAPLYPVALALLGKGIRECLGTIGVSVLRNTPMVVPAQSDIHVDGFIGYGRYDLPTEDGGRAGVVMVKGPTEAIDDHLQAIRAAVCSEFGGRVAGRGHRRSV